MSAGTRSLGVGLIVVANFLAAGCYCHSGSNVMTSIGNRELPTGISKPRVGMEDVNPAGFSSTYRRYQIDRQRIARQKAEQEAALQLAMHEPSE